MDNMPPNVVVMPINENIPNMIIIIPHIGADFGILFIIKALKIIISPKIRKPKSVRPMSKKIAKIVPINDQSRLPKNTNIPPTKEKINAVVGFSLIFSPKCI